MKPFMRRLDQGKVAPAGWVAEPTRPWGGHQVEVVFDPRRHEVIHSQNDMGDHTRAALASIGFQCVARDGDQELWVRDRVEPLRQRLQQPTSHHPDALTMEITR